MLRNLLTGVVLFGAAVASAPAQAQFSIELGGGPRYDSPYRSYERPYERRYEERRVYRGRSVIDDDDDDCRIVERRRVNRFGEVVVRRVRVCD
jgi:hypothetical protein